ncbi:MAG: nucleotide exchange factor GrpE [Eubacteriales bacterium]
MNNSKGKNKNANEAVSEKDSEQKNSENAECACAENCPVDTADGEEIITDESVSADKFEESAEPEEAVAENTEDDTGIKDKRTLKAEMKNMKEENKKLAAACSELEDRYLRMIAEYDNFRRRSVKERESAYTDAYSDALKEILPVIDNLERALTFANAESKIDDKLTEGVIMTLNQFTEALGHMGVVAVGARGDTFNPDFHNAVMHEEDDTKGINEIADVFLKGYKREDKVIRFAMVKVVN